jgi:hypothetical protein
MNTGGHGNDGLMTLAPIGIAIIVGVILYGGPTNALEAVNDLIRDIVYLAMDLVTALV